MNFILASASPRRHELFKHICSDFQVIPSRFDERKIEFNGNPEEYVTTLSKGKAEDVAVNFPSDTIIGMDTVVFKDGKILNKPANRDEAEKMIRFLSNRSHYVYTGFCIINKERNILKFGFEKTEVIFTEIDESELKRYLLTGDYEGKAGAYAIQGEASIFAKSVNGDFFNVVGLPVSRIYNEFKELGLME